MATPTTKAPPVRRPEAQEIPREQRMVSARTPGPLAMVIFGATGDLTRRKLMPALFHLFSHGLIPRCFAIVGFAREAFSDDDFRERMLAAVREFDGEPDAELWGRFAQRLYYVGSVFEDPEGFLRLDQRLKQIDEECGTAGNRLYYMATPPTVVAQVGEHLARAGLIHEPGGKEWTRIIVEKPFGRDLESARALNRELHRVF
ncbi:MAG: glucose-6-phosphate dehydrogenase, partial [Gemmatimonadetes bacterium]|nr:glucose-6-phosphate dehydrogenase [Gemmatimonadota bacterium]